MFCITLFSKVQISSSIPPLYPPPSPESFPQHSISNSLQTLYKNRVSYSPKAKVKFEFSNKDRQLLRTPPIAREVRKNSKRPSARVLPHSLEPSRNA